MGCDSAAVSDDGRDEIIAGFTEGIPVVGFYTYDPATNTFRPSGGFVVQEPEPNGLNVGGSS